MENGTKRSRFLRLLLVSAVVIAGILLVDKFFIQNLKNSRVNLINVALIYYFSVAGMYLMLGLGGCMSMCSIAVMGLSAFVCGFTNTKLGWPLFPAMLCGILSSVILCAVVGSLLMKLDGRAFMFGTMALVYIGTSVFQNFSAFTGGPNGTSGISKLTLFGKTFSTFKSWFVLLAIACYLLILLLHRIKNTSFGRSLMAARDDETAAYSLGVNVYRTKLLAFIISGVFSGIGGALYAVHNGTISASLFSFTTQQSFIIMLMLGGVSVFSARSGVAPANSLDYIFSGKEPLQWTTKSPSVTIPRRTGTMSVPWRGGGPPSAETPPTLSCFPPPRAFFFSTPKRATLTFCCWTSKWAAWTG